VLVKTTKPKIETAPPRKSTVARMPVNSPGDSFEREADKVADQAMNSRPENLRSYFETRFGHDFSRVRVHTDNEAAEAAQAVQARAYTLGSDIVFGKGEYAPTTPSGRRLLAHEMTHVVQQRQGAAMIMRQPQQTTTTPPSALDQLPDAAKQKLTFDTEATKPLDLRQFFGLQGTVIQADNVDPDIDIEAPAIDALTDSKIKSALYSGLRNFALGTFDLLPDNKGKAHTKRLNLVHVENLDLTPWKGPNTSYRFSCTGSDTGGKIKVKILIEALDLPAKSMADAAARPGVEKSKADPYGLRRDPSVSDDQWQKVLGSLGRFQESMIMRIRDVTFETSTQQAGPKGEMAQYLAVFKDGKWTKKIILFQQLNGVKDADFAFTIAHEIGHAVDEAPAELPTGLSAQGNEHNLPKFLEAAKKDGGRAKAITKYGSTDDSEFFAECMAMFIQQPDTLKTLRPNIFAFFHDFQFAALQDPKLNPNYKAPGQGNPAGGSKGLSNLF
jgi:Domain of unknown function (DUF4157)